MPSPSIELPQGTLDLLILRTLALEPLHGWAVSERIQQISSDMLRVQQGSLYPALHRLERHKLISGDWAISENGRRARYYTVTGAGRKRLKEHEGQWSSLSLGVGRVLEFV